MSEDATRVRPSPRRDGAGRRRHRPSRAPDRPRPTSRARSSGSIPGTACSRSARRRAMRDLLFAIIPHKVRVNLQLADGAELPDPDGRIEGTGKRIRHVKVRSVERPSAPWVRAVSRPSWRTEPDAGDRLTGASRRHRGAATRLRSAGSVRAPRRPRDRRSASARSAGTSTRTGRACSRPAAGPTASATTRCGPGTTSTRSSAATTARSSRAG